MRCFVSRWLPGRRDLGVSTPPVGETSWSRCSRSAGACPPRWPSARCRLRSFRTYMSIAARVVLFSRAFRSLIKTRAALAKPIKDLKALRLLRVCACYRHSGPTDLKRTRDVFSVARTMARGTRSHARVACEGPSPTVKAGFSPPVARGPVPRDLSPSAENARSPEATDVCCSDRCMARDRPSPYGESGNQAWRGKPPRMRVWHARAQALREGAAFFSQRGAYHLNVERFMKHPHFNAHYSIR